MFAASRSSTRSRTPIAVSWRPKVTASSSAIAFSSASDKETNLSPIMSEPTGSVASNWTDEAQPDMPPQDRKEKSRGRSGYLHDLALRREALTIRRQIVYG